MDSKNFGEIVELKFALKANEQGLIVSKPFGDNQKYDYIVDHNGKLSRVQVKATSQLDKHRHRYKISAAHGCLSKTPYTPQDADFLAGYISPLDIWYIIPVRRLTGVSVRLYPHDPSSTGRYEPYQESWSLLLSA